MLVAQYSVQTKRDCRLEACYDHRYGRRVTHKQLFGTTV
jgi:hypothetical protein